MRVVSPTQLAFADYRGNRQMLSTGNLAANDRVALFLMDYPRRERLKILGHAASRTRANIPNLSRSSRTGSPSHRRAAILHRSHLVRLELSEYITPLHGREIETAVAPLRQRIADLKPS